MPNILLLKVALVAAAVFFSAIFLAVRDGIVAGFSVVVAAILRSPFIVSPMAYVVDLPSGKINLDSLLRLLEKGISVTLDEIKMMIAAGADLHATDEYGGTPLHLMAIAGNAEVVSALIIVGANVHARDNNGHTSLHEAAHSGSIESISILIKARANLNAKTKNGETPLFLAIQVGHIEVVSQLLKAGVNPNVQIKGGFTPLSIAKKLGKSAIVKLLEEAGAESPKSTADFAACRDGNNAHILAKDVIREELASLSLSLVNFPLSAESITAKHDADANMCVYRVHSYVDAKDSSGAIIRRKWFVTLRHHQNETWEIDTAQFIDWRMQGL